MLTLNKEVIIKIKNKTLYLIINIVKNSLALIIIIAVFCLISPGTAEDAISVDSVSSGSTVGDSTITISHTTSGYKHLMLVGVSINNDNYETVTEVTTYLIGYTGELSAVIRV